MARTYRGLQKWIGDDGDMDLLAMSLARALRNRGKTIYLREEDRRRRKRGKGYDGSTPTNDY